MIKRKTKNQANNKIISQKEYNNPYFQNKKKTKNSYISRSSLKFKIGALAFTTLTIFVLWFVIYSNYFKVRNVVVNLEKVTDIGGVSEEQIEKIALRQLRTSLIFLPQNNIFIFNEKKLYDTLISDLAFEKIEIIKKYPNELILNLKEVSYAIIWEEGGLFYYMTTKGDLIKEVDPLELKNIFPLINNVGNALFLDNKIIGRGDHIKFAINLYKTFKDENILNIEKFVLDDISQNQNTVSMKLFDGPLIHFDIKEDRKKQEEKLMVLKNEKLKDDFFKKEYIDLRFGDMIYYR